MRVISECGSLTEFGCHINAKHDGLSETNEQKNQILSEHKGVTSLWRIGIDDTLWTHWHSSAGQASCYDRVLLRWRIYDNVFVTATVSARRYGLSA